MEIWYNWGFLPDDTKVCQTCVYWEGERHREGHNVYCLGQTDGICNNFDWAGYQQLFFAVFVVYADITSGEKDSIDKVKIEWYNINRAC